jgi:hypothetical protein
MKLLIDECIDELLLLSLPQHERRTATFAGLAGLKNEQLLEGGGSSRLRRT